MAYVVDLGAASCKVGPAAGAPLLVPSVVGAPRFPRALGGSETSHFGTERSHFASETSHFGTERSHFTGETSHLRQYAGAEALKRRGVLALREPLAGDVSWPDLEVLLESLSGTETSHLRSETSHFPTSETSHFASATSHFVVPPRSLGSARSHLRLAEILYENLAVPRLFLAPHGPCALFAAGRTTGLAVDVGESHTSGTAMFDGFLLPKCEVSVPVGGADVTLLLSQLLALQGNRDLAVPASRFLVRALKETAGSVRSQSPTSRFGATPWALLAEAEVGARGLGSEPRGLTSEPRGLTSAEPRGLTSAEPRGLTSAEPRGHTSAKTYTLPDGAQLAVGPEFALASEALFTPSLVGKEVRGLTSLIADLALRADCEVRASLLENLTLTGGVSLTHGLAERVKCDLAVHLAGRAFRLAAPANREVAVWRGAAVLATSRFQDLAVPRSAYEEDPSSVLRSFAAWK